MQTRSVFLHGRTALLFFLALLLFFSCLFGTAAAGEPKTENDFKRMKISELRQFLDDRGLSCYGCQEKSEFVRVAYENRDKAPFDAQRRKDIPDASFWDAWKENVKEICDEGAKKRGLEALETTSVGKVCEALSHATESVLMQHGKAIAQGLRKKQGEILKTSYTNVFYDAGLVLFRRIVDYCLASDERQKTCGSVTELIEILNKGKVADLKMWVVNVAIGNTNPMYELVEQQGGDL